MRISDWSSDVCSSDLRRIIDNTLRTVPNPEAMQALGFCVSVAHARFMEDQFNAKDIPAVAVSADTPRDDRRQALMALAAGDIRVVFSVNLLKEGIVIQSVDTLLLFHPTVHPPILLQQP